MKVIYGEGTRQPEQFRLLENASAKLEEHIGHSAANVTAEWERESDTPRGPQYRLRISDPTGESAGSIATDVLGWPNLLRARLGILWDGVLQQRGEKLLKDLMETSI